MRNQEKPMTYLKINNRMRNKMNRSQERMMKTMMDKPQILKISQKERKQINLAADRLNLMMSLVGLGKSEKNTKTNNEPPSETIRRTASQKETITTSSKLPISTTTKLTPETTTINHTIEMPHSPNTVLAKKAALEVTNAPIDIIHYYFNLHYY
jgi:hypothetical protein